MASKAIVHREKTAQNLRACLQSHGEEAATELALALQPEATPEVEVPDMEGFQILLRRRLDTTRQRLVAADEAHLKDLRRLAALRASRDMAVGELRRLLARLRQAVDGVHGPGAAADALLLEGLTPRDPVVLQRTVARTLEHLEEFGLPRPTGALAAIDLAPNLWMDLLREPLSRLDDSLAKLVLEKRAAVDSLLAKNAAKKAYDRLYSSTTRMLQEFFRYVGMDEMAATLRPKRRKAPQPLIPVAVGAGLVSAQAPSRDEDEPLVDVQTPSTDEAESLLDIRATTRVAPTGIFQHPLALAPRSRAPAPDRALDPGPRASPPD